MRILGSSECGTLDVGEQFAMPNEGTRKAHDVSELLIEIRDNTRTTCVKLFGSTDADEENETGRLPKLEKSSAEQSKRLGNLEKKLNRAWDRIAVAIVVLLWVWEHFGAKKGS